MTFEIGPLVLSGAVLVVLTAVFVGLMVGNYTAGKSGIKAEASLWWVLAGTVLLARLVFVLRYWSLYSEELWRLADLRDGGLDPVAGIAGAVLIGALLAWRRQKQRPAILGAVSAGLLVWIAGAALLDRNDVRQPLPQVTLTDLTGRALPMSEFAGKPVAINLWASWCPPCRREMPVLEKAQRDAPDVHFVFVNQGEDAATVLTYLQAENLHLKNVLLDQVGLVPRMTGGLGLPTTLFFNAHGDLVDQRMGEVSPATLAAHLEVLRQSTGTVIHLNPGAMQ